MIFWKGLVESLAGTSTDRGMPQAERNLPGRLSRMARRMMQPDARQPAAATKAAPGQGPLARPLPGLPLCKERAKLPVARQAVKHHLVTLLGAGEFQEGIDRCEEGAKVLVEPKANRDGSFVATLLDGTAIGRIAANRALALALSSADAVLEARVIGCSGQDRAGRLLAPRVQILTGPRHAHACVSQFNPARMRSVPLAGPQRFQAAIRKLVAGEAVTLVWEPKTCPGAGLIVALNWRGEALGYLPDDDGLYRAISLAGESGPAHVRHTAIGKSGFWTAILDVPSFGEARPGAGGAMRALYPC